MKLSKSLSFLILFLYLGSVSQASQCRDMLTSNQSQNISFDIIKDQILETLGLVSPNKMNLVGEEDFLNCGSTENCIEILSQTPIKYKIYIKPDLRNPEISTSRSSKSISLPSLDYLKLEDGKNHFRQFLVGHRLHPYSLGGELRLKPSQRVAVEAFLQFLNTGQKKYLHVAPTSMGKSLSMIEGYKFRLSQERAKKLSIFSADRINITNQLADNISESISTTDLRVLNWNEHSSRGFRWLLETLRSQSDNVALVMTTQSLKNFVNFVSSRDITFLRNILDGVYLDEAHHYGAQNTREAIDSLVESSDAFLYGMTATPFHHEVNLRELFDLEHWSYLNELLNLFEEHDAEKVIDQLRIGIELGELSPFKDLYFIGEPNFNASDERPLFISGTRNRYVLNPEHYNRFAQIISPIIKDNSKGFIVASTIAEAERLSEFLSNAFSDITFEAYHSGLDQNVRDSILERSRTVAKHFIISVRSLDEGVNLPHLSAYIDINASMSVKQLIHRIGRVLRLYEGKISSDILFLSDYRDADLARDLIHLIDIAEGRRFDTSDSYATSGDVNFINPGVEGLSREDLIEARRLLQKVIKEFWSRQPVEFMTYNEARDYIRSQGIKTVEEYWIWAKSDNRPQNFPYSPWDTYKNRGWTGFNDFVGTPRVVNKNWMSFDEARAFIQTQDGVTSLKKFQAWLKTGLRPDNFPSHPNRTYKDYWKGWGHFLGTGVESNRNIQWMTFTDAKAFIQNLNITTWAEFYEWAKSDKRPKNFPTNPQTVYKDSGWLGIGDFLRTGVIQNSQKAFMSFEEARIFIQTQGLSTSAEFREWAKSDKRPDNFPYNPARTYADQGWAGFSDFLGNGRVQNIVWMTYTEARDYIRVQSITTVTEFEAWKQAGNRPANFPANPSAIYRNSGWSGWPTFLGTD